MSDMNFTDLHGSESHGPDSHGSDQDLAQALRRLPMAEPLPGGWARMQQSLRAEAPRRRTAPHPAWWALAASLVLASAMPSLLRPPADPVASGSTAVSALPTDQDNPRLDVLQRESALLDLMVAQKLGSGAQQADWAALSLQVVERVQWIDSVLGQPGHSDAAQLALWSERVLLLRQLANPQDTPGWRSAEASAGDHERSFAL